MRRKKSSGVVDKGVSTADEFDVPSAIKSEGVEPSEDLDDAREEQAVGQKTFSDEGDEITVAWGEEKMFPVPGDRFSSFTAGAVYYKTRARRGESIEDAAARAYTIAAKIGERARRSKYERFMKFVREIGEGK